MLDIKVKGIKEAIKIIDSLNPNVQRKVYESAISKSLNPMLRRGRAAYNADPHPYSTGKNRGARSLTKVRLKRGEVIGYRAKPSKRKGGGIVHLLDLGTKERFTKTGASRGSIKGSNYWSDSIQSNAQSAIKAGRDNIVKALDQYMKKQIKKYKITKI